MSTTIQYGRQTIEEDDIRAVAETLRSDWLTTGPKVAEFEEKFAKYVGSRYAVAVSNASVGLRIAVQVSFVVYPNRLKSNPQGITTPLTFIATANSMLDNGITPVFADIGPDLNIDPKEIKKKINSNTLLVMPVHFRGVSCDMKRIRRMFKGVIIEDAAHALGSRYENGKRVGSCCYSDVTVFSFHPVKTITTGEGGMITTNNRRDYQTLLQYRNHGMVDGMMMERAGNYRLTDFQSALGISQLNKVDRFIKRRREIVKMYNLAFKKNHYIKLPYENKLFTAYHLYILLIDFYKLGKTREQVRSELLKKGVGTQIHYLPVNQHLYYRAEQKWSDAHYKNTEDYFEKCLTIPLYPSMTNTDVLKVITAINEVI